jgi:hypothetical protein
MKKLIILGALAAALASAEIAVADPGRGATITDHESCISSPLATSCWDLKAVTKTTTTPSGNVSHITNGTNDYTVSLPLSGCTSTKSEPVHIHWLTQDGEPQSHSERLSQTTSFSCTDGYSYSCTSSFELHLANGEVQFQRPEFTCTSD